MHRTCRFYGRSQRYKYKNSPPSLASSSTFKLGGCQSVNSGPWRDDTSIVKARVCVRMQTCYHRKTTQDRTLNHPNWPSRRIPCQQSVRPKPNLSNLPLFQLSPRSMVAKQRKYLSASAVCRGSSFMAFASTCLFLSLEMSTGIGHDIGSIWSNNMSRYPAVLGQISSIVGLRTP